MHVRYNRYFDSEIKLQICFQCYCVAQVLGFYQSFYILGSAQHKAFRVPVKDNTSFRKVYQTMRNNFAQYGGRTKNAHITHLYDICHKIFGYNRATYYQLSRT